MATIDNKKNKIVKVNEPKTKTEIKKKKVVIILNKIRHDLLDYYLDSNIAAELQKNIAVMIKLIF